MGCEVSPGSEGLIVGYSVGDSVGLSEGDMVGE